MAFLVHDKIRDKMYVDIRQTFSLWFIPMYHAHVRLVTVLDLVANDDADFHDPLDRIIKQEKEGGEKPTAQLLYHASLANENHHHNHHNNNKGHGPRRYKIHRQEDLYQVNEFLKFVGGPGPLPFLWFLFQMQATALCIFMSLFVRLSPWRFQPEPARGGVEAIIERVESYHDLPSSERLEEKSHSHQRENKPKSKPQKKVEEEKPTTPINEKTHESGNGSENRDTAESTSTVGATNGHNGQPHEQPHAQQHMQSQEKHHEQPQTQHHTQPNELPHPQSNAQREQRPKHEQNNGSGPNSGDTRRESANSKASPTQPRKQGKSGKKGGSGGGGR